MTQGGAGKGKEVVISATDNNEVQRLGEVRSYLR